MTRNPNNFKYTALFILVGCNNQSSPDPNLTELSILQQESILLEKRALDIESKVDELRRANVDNQDQQREELERSIQQFQIDLIAFESNLSTWKHQLIVGPNNTPPSDVVVPPKDQTEPQ